MLAVEAIDDHPLLVGAKIQSIPVCRISVYCLAVFLMGVRVSLKCNTPVQREVPSWSGTSSRLTAYKHGLSKSVRVGVTGWMHLDLKV